MLPGRRLTLLIIPEEGGRTYEYKVARLLVWLVGLGFTVLLIVLALGLRAMVHSENLSDRVVRLQRDKDILVDEVQRVDQLETMLRRLQRSNAQLRRITADAVGLRESGPFAQTNRVGEQLVTVVDRLRYGRLRTVPTLTPVRAARPTYQGDVLVFQPPARSLVRASAAGRVVAWEMGIKGDYYLTLDHGNGVSTQYTGVSTPTVEDGQFVQKGQPLGLSHPWLGVRFTLIENGLVRRPGVGELWL